jgi:hypothetical protein
MKGEDWGDPTNANLGPFAFGHDVADSGRKLAGQPIRTEHPDEAACSSTAKARPTKAGASRAAAETAGCTRTASYSSAGPTG